MSSLAVRADEHVNYRNVSTDQSHYCAYLDKAAPACLVVQIAEIHRCLVDELAAHCGRQVSKERVERREANLGVVLAGGLLAVFLGRSRFGLFLEQHSGHLALNVNKRLVKLPRFVVLKDLNTSNKREKT